MGRLAKIMTTESPVCHTMYAAPMHRADPEASLRCCSALPLAESRSHSPAQHSTAQRLSEKHRRESSHADMSNICSTMHTCTATVLRHIVADCEVFVILPTYNLSS